MRNYGSLMVLLVGVLMGVCVQGRITLESMRYLGGVTEGGYGILKGLDGKVEGRMDGMGGAGLGREEQVVFGGRGGYEKGALEDKITKVLQNLTTTLRFELDKPLSLSSPSRSQQALNQDPLTNHQLSTNTTNPCPTILTEYKSFLSSTVHFLHAIQELQMINNYGESSGVAGGVRLLQRMWASRSGNSQNRSFIEQQIACYNPTGCFPKNEVLIRGVEVVEYLNDLLDLFN